MCALEPTWKLRSPWQRLCDSSPDGWELMGLPSLGGQSRDEGLEPLSAVGHSGPVATSAESWDQGGHNSPAIDGVSGNSDQPAPPGVEGDVLDCP